MIMSKPKKVMRIEAEEYSLAIPSSIKSYCMRNGRWGNVGKQHLQEGIGEATKINFKEHEEPTPERRGGFKRKETKIKRKVPCILDDFWGENLIVRPKETIHGRGKPGPGWKPATRSCDCKGQRDSYLYSWVRRGMSVVRGGQTGHIRGGGGGQSESIELKRVSKEDQSKGKVIALKRT